MAKEGFASGKPLAEIAASHTAWKSSDLGLIAESELLTAVADAVRPLKTGQVSAPVRTPFGWHVLLVMGRQAAKAPTYEQMLPELTTELRRSEWQAHLAALLKKAKAATIEPDGKHRPLNLAPAAE